MTLSSLLTRTTPKYELVVPSTKEKKVFRPFFVKEEKVLLAAQESQNIKEIYLAIQDVIESCVEDIKNVNELPLFDVEYIFTQLRAKSIGEIITPLITCPETNEQVHFNINLTEVEVQFNKNHKNVINLADKLNVVMKYPSIKSIMRRDDDSKNDLYEMVIDCIDSIENDAEEFHCGDYSRKEIEEFVNHLTKQQFSLLLDFLITSPRLEHTVDYTTSDGEERRLQLSGLSDFFL
jgi:hypothetical protein